MAVVMILSVAVLVIPMVVVPVVVVPVVVVPVVVVAVVVVPVVVMVVTMAGAGAPELVDQEPPAQGHDQDPGGRAHPRHDLPVVDVLGGEEGDQAQEKDAEGVGEGDHAAEEHGIAHGAAAAHEVGGDDRLAVARLQAVGGPGHEGQRQGSEDDAGAQLFGAHHPFEGILQARHPLIAVIAGGSGLYRYGNRGHQCHEDRPSYPNDRAHAFSPG